MIYIDFDGVILDTSPLLFEEWLKIPNCDLLSEEEKIKYIQECNWTYVLNNSKIINDSIYYLNNMDYKTSFILTKIHSQSEGVAKVIWLRSKGIKQSVILAPYEVRKVDMVSAKDNILVDDSLRNLNEWRNSGGIPILFDIDNDNHDNWNQPNIDNYEKVYSLSKFK